MGKIFDKARGQLDKARENYIPSGKSTSTNWWGTVPCAKRGKIIDRIVERIGEERGRIMFDQSRLTEKLRVISIMGRGNEDREYIRDIVKAMDALSDAKHSYDRSLRNARDVRNWTRKVCRKARK
jgi:hypothetical protein